MLTPTNEKVNKFLADRGIKKVWLADKIGMNLTTLYAKLAGDIRLNSDDIESFCFALNCEPNDLIALKGKDNENIS